MVHGKREGERQDPRQRGPTWYRPRVSTSAVATCIALALACTGAGAPGTTAGSGSERALDPAAPRGVEGPADVDVPEPATTPPVPDAPAGEGDEDDDDTAIEIDERPGYDPVRDSPAGIQARKRIIGGVALSLAGAALTLGGIALGATDPCRPAAGNSCQVGARNRAAWVLGVPGVAILAGGITLLTLGVLGRRRVVASFAASRRGASLGVMGRF
jgi:hypothetical protein